ncbi:triphosphoribosyl-dephospho-CoA synthase [Allorhodopirellula solitaria]|uniref:ATP:dephospho-CoA triphosphoribosyl transferase n=1 Tax=Allorhodopirellula solitaria TaxID=2527987 RepID=A0A5C5YFX4_9BACT|nr:triphosphoribosyl-dephospho-CoA synthase [Allorhodopirellula solitaria]TWT74004.1 ATP:dephospho-CoA triphosphoribosyl transferase [Allorhodopirellula solitaria]
MNEPKSVADGVPIWCLLAASAARRVDAVRMACVLEATAPKVGNVHPAAHFHDLNYTHFVSAADATASMLADLSDVDRVGAVIHSAVTASVVATGTNVNLGILLLLGPLLSSEPDWQRDRTHTHSERLTMWQSQTAEQVARIDPHQGALIASAISGAGAGGLTDASLGNDHPLDVNGNHRDSYDILAAMRLAASRDRIAAQYAGGFRDLFQHVVPALQHSVASSGDLLSGIVLAHINLIADSGDSLIARKCGQAESDRVARLAKECLDTMARQGERQRVESIRRFDKVLRADGNRLNPGTTADLIAAAIYVLIRTQPHREVTDRVS